MDNQHDEIKEHLTMVLGHECPDPRKTSEAFEIAFDAEMDERPRCPKCSGRLNRVLYPLVEVLDLDSGDHREMSAGLCWYCQSCTYYHHELMDPDVENLPVLHPLVSCEACGLMYVAQKKHQRYCGPGCWPSNAVVKMRWETCPACGKEHQTTGGYYCSRSCRLKGRSQGVKAHD